MTHFDEISALVQERYGLVPRDRWSEDLRAHIAKLAQAGGVSGPSMASRLLQEPALLADAVGALTIKESYFFRHKAHFEFLVARARRELARPNARYLVWSAGCASGEEPYSIAIALRNALATEDLSRVVVMATDADRCAITAAEAGRYSAWAFRGVEPTVIARHFRPQPDRSHAIDAGLRQCVAFRHASLQAHVAELADASLDAIFFRNVSVYLTERATAELFCAFARVLRPGGLLFVAATDARPRIGEFGPAHSQDTTVFERRLAAEASDPPPVSTRLGGMPSWRARRRKSSRPPPSRHGRTTRSEDRHCPADGSRRVDDLADRGDLVGALALVTERLATGEDAAPAYQRRGSIHLALCDFAAAIEDFRRVLYLEPENTAARYWYALALRQAGNREAACHQLSLVAAGTDDEALRSTARALIGELS